MNMKICNIKSVRWIPVVLVSFLGLQNLCANPVIESWVTSAGREQLMEKDVTHVSFSNKKNRKGNPIVVDERQSYQSIDGFGFALTGGSAEHIMNMNPEARSVLLQELFGRSKGDAGISYIRLSIGASDLNRFVFSYNDLPLGETDFELKRFDLAQDRLDVIPVMKEILAINPDILVMGSPWSAPVWMKTHGDVRGGHLRQECYGTYALYFVKYIEEMAKSGIRIDSITIQNEPLNSRNTPSMPWSLDEQRTFLRDYLKPVFNDRGIVCKVILFDHNCDRPDYPLALLNDSEISEFADGSAFHHYGGDMSAMSLVHIARPDKNLYFSEQMITEDPESKQIAIAARVERMIIQTMRNWSRNVILWNLAADPLNDPHTDNGGCSMCQGAITIDGNKVRRNIAYYTIAHASKWVEPGSFRIASTEAGDSIVSLTEDEERPGLIRSALIQKADVLPNVAFRTPKGKIVLIVANTSFYKRNFEIQYHGRFALLELEPGAVGTYLWDRI